MINEIIGSLGFILSIFENRKKLKLHIYINHYSDRFHNEIKEKNAEFIIIQITNIGSKPIIIDKHSFSISSKVFSIKHHTDWFGLYNIPVPINSGQSFEVGIALDSFEHFHITKNDTKAIIDIKASVSDIEGKIYKTNKNYKYLQEVSEII